MKFHNLLKIPNGLCNCYMIAMLSQLLKKTVDIFISHIEKRARLISRQKFPMERKKNTVYIMVYIKRREWEDTNKIVEKTVEV